MQMTSLCLSQSDQETNILTLSLNQRKFASFSWNREKQKTTQLFVNRSRDLRILTENYSPETKWPSLSLVSSTRTSFTSVFINEGSNSVEWNIDWIAIGCPQLEGFHTTRKLMEPAELLRVSQWERWKQVDNNATLQYGPALNFYNVSTKQIVESKGRILLTELVMRQYMGQMEAVVTELVMQ